MSSPETGWPDVSPTDGLPEVVELVSDRPVSAAAKKAAARTRKWRVDAWAAWRPGDGLRGAANGARPASYGGTQFGAVGRLYLGSDPRAPALHVRATYAPHRPRQAELAAGAGFRPIPKVPVRVMAEVRATRTGSDTFARPAAFAVTELPVIQLPEGVALEGYAQGGWVGGRFSTGFIDGQARLSRDVAGFGPAKVSLGAGIWGGAQRGAARLDVGPSVSVALDSRTVPLRIALDYRVRVAGGASPGNGPALTLSTGF
jgi:hypothetical protein